MVEATDNSSEKVIEISALMEFIEQEAEALSNIYFEDNVIGEPPVTVKVPKHVLATLKAQERKSAIEQDTV